ncbi:hypothetical protein BDV29DRAFT_163773 [Aspergillus leporis]|uniref:Extracellular membrane protein CFEM domain-containing protein n=1 Tax=Aspergillus leporis TaxID=41062 RepID=A0A5N5WFS3_9EURO|nr:hypothetical protein BDV29DRAFT_163773 [Aspergillus leporis]
MIVRIFFVIALTFANCHVRAAAISPSQLDDEAGLSHRTIDTAKTMLSSEDGSVELSTAIDEGLRAADLSPASGDPMSFSDAVDLHAAANPARDTAALLRRALISLPTIAHRAPPSLAACIRDVQSMIGGCKKDVRRQIASCKTRQERAIAACKNDVRKGIDECKRKAKNIWQKVACEAPAAHRMPLCTPGKHDIPLCDFERPNTLCCESPRKLADRLCRVGLSSRQIRGRVTSAQQQCMKREP